MQRPQSGSHSPGPPKHRAPELLKDARPKSDEKEEPIYEIPIGPGHSKTQKTTHQPKIEEKICRKENPIYDNAKEKEEHIYENIGPGHSKAQKTTYQPKIEEKICREEKPMCENRKEKEERIYENTKLRNIPEYAKIIKKQPKVTSQTEKQEPIYLDLLPEPTPPKYSESEPPPIPARNYLPYYPTSGKSPNYIPLPERAPKKESFIHRLLKRHSKKDPSNTTKKLAKVAEAGTGAKGKEKKVKPSFGHKKDKTKKPK